jgi:hypothetical protein
MDIVYSIGGVAITNRVNFLKEGGSFVTSAFRTEYGSGGIRIEDPAGNLNIAGWETFWVDDMDATPTRVWQGYIYDKTLERGELPPVGVNRVHDCEIIDLNAALQFQVLHSNDAKRPAETDVAKVNWLMTSEAITGYGSNLLVDGGLISSADPVDFLAVDTRRSYANAVLRTLCEIAQKNAFAYVDEYTGLAALFYDKDESAVFESDIRISNVIADEDGVTTFYPSLDASLLQSGADRYGGVLFTWQGEDIYVQSPATVTAMSFSRDAVVADEKQIGDAATAETEAQSFLNTHAGENGTIRVTIYMPSASVNQLVAGHRMQVKFTHLPGFETFTWTRVRRRGVRPIGVDIDGTWTVLWEVVLELWVPPVPVDDTAPIPCGTNVFLENCSHVNLGWGNGWFDGSGATVEVCPQGGERWFESGRYDNDTGLFGTGHIVSIDSVRIDWAASAESAEFYFEGGTYPSGVGTGYLDSTSYNWTTLLHAYNGQGGAGDYDNLAGTTLGAHWNADYPGSDYTFPLGGTATYQFWRFRVPAAKGNSDIATMAGSLACVEALPFAGDPITETPAGTVDNSNTDFTTAGPWLPGTLVVLHDATDQTAHVTTSDPVAGTFTLDYSPSFGSTIRTRYESA